MQVPVLRATLAYYKLYSQDYKNLHHLGVYGTLAEPAKLV